LDGGKEGSDERTLGMALLRSSQCCVATRADPLYFPNRPFIKTECTYSHFEQSSQCPTCNRRLGESDFTELVVADGNGADIQKTTMQTLFQKRSATGCLPYADICQTLIHQIDVSKQSTKFLLKQLLVESHRAGRNSVNAARMYESLKNENIQLKQQVHSQRLQYEQRITELENKVKAKDGTIAEQSRMIQKFQGFHCGKGGSSGGGGVAAPHMVPNSSNVSLASSRAGSGRGGPEPPLRGLMAQREADRRAQQNAMNGNKRPFMNAIGYCKVSPDGCSFSCVSP